MPPGIRAAASFHASETEWLYFDTTGYVTARASGTGRSGAGKDCRVTPKRKLKKGAVQVPSFGKASGCTPSPAQATNDSLRTAAGHRRLHARVRALQANFACHV
jgi:hypothetical protein